MQNIYIAFQELFVSWPVFVLNGDHQYYKMEKWWKYGLEQSIIPNVTVMYITQVISYFM